jgi:hypothetical protein
MGITYRKNNEWNFVIIKFDKENIKTDIENFFNSERNMKKYGKNIDIIETEFYDKFEILVKFIIVPEVTRGPVFAH